MTLFKIFLLAVTLSGCAHTYSNGNSSDIPDFESLVGSGTLEKSGTTIETTHSTAWITVIDNEVIPGKESCKSFMLNSKDELVIKIAHCEDSQEYFICGGNGPVCIIDFDTDKSGNSLSLINDFSSDEVRHVVEIHKEMIIYRIQLESCLIPYPHGCIIDGFNWVDLDVYSFRKK